MNTKQLNKYERIWFLSFLLIILTTTFIFSAKNTDYNNAQSIMLNWIISPVSALTGIVSAILVAKGKISNYVWGFVNAVFYAYLAYMGGYYGDMLIYILWNTPMRLVGFLSWKSKLKQNSKTDVRVRKMSWKQTIITFFFCMFGIILFGILLENIDYWFINIMQRNRSIYQYFEDVFGVKYIGSMIDSSTVIFQIAGTILMTQALTEQWLIWIVANIISIVMWAVVIISDPSSISWAMPTLIMWIAYLINSIYGYTSWLKEAKTEYITI